MDVTEFDLESGYFNLKKDNSGVTVAQSPASL